MTDFTLLRGADVKVTQIVDDKKRNVAEIVVDGRFHHRFSHTSRVSKHLDIMEAKDLQSRLTGGSYFFIGDQMVDFRDNQYNGFIHTDKTIGVFMNMLGYQPRSALPRHRQRVQRADSSDATTCDIVLRKVWDKTEIAVPGYAAGGEFTTELSFGWNPFVKTIDSSFDLVRQICSNGMVGLTSFLNTKVPLLNRWEEHLDIATRQIQNKVNNIVINRVQNMSKERASVADCLLLTKHALDRLNGTAEKTPEERDVLKTIITAASPKVHLHNIYQDAVFQDKNLAAQMPAHLTHFDVFNIATELRSHTQEIDKSSHNALDKFANAVLFDRDGGTLVGTRGAASVKTAIFSDVDRAFFGKMH